MKHITLLFLLISTSIFAQNKFIYGVNVGATYANIRGNEIANNNEYKPNFMIGGSIEVPLSERFSFLGNINYERKSYAQTLEMLDLSGNFDPIVSSKEVDLKERLEYLTIPLNIKWYMGSQKKFFINGGAFTGVFLVSTAKLDGELAYTNGGGLFKSFDFGLNLGFGTKIKITQKYRMNLELRHNLGLSTINEFQTINNKGQKTNSFNLIANWPLN